MRAFAQKQNQPEKRATAGITTSSRMASAESHRAASDFAHDFSRIPVHAPVAGVIQAKLGVNTPGDVYEQEADAVAEQVMGMSTPSAPQIQRRAEGEGLIRRKTTGDARAQTAPPKVQEVLRTPGQPLDGATRAFMEPRFGHDFSRVRVHTDRDAAESARSVDAVAYTVGRDIVFGRGQYAPHTEPGRRLIAHELSHVVQQHATGSAAGSPGLVLQRQADDTRTLETETISTPRHVRTSEWLVAKAAGGGTVRTELYWVDFEVDDTGVMRASVRTVTPDRAYRSAKLRFGDQFRAALQHFSAKGVAVNAFEGDWSYMTKDEISENLRVFREGMAAGKTRENAALDTPSGRVATRSGFVLTSVENVPESQEHLAEEGVRRWRVKAVFRRPPATPAPGPVNPPPGGTTAGLPKQPAVRAGRGRLATVEPDAADEFEGGRGGGRLSGLGSIALEVIGPMLEAFAWELIPALSNKLWERDKKRLEAEILQRLNSPDSLRRIADYQIDELGTALYGNVTVEIVTEDSIQQTGTTESGFPIMRSSSYYESSRLIDVQVSDKYIKRTSKKRGSRNLPAQSITVNTFTETYSVAIPQLENKFIRARLEERIAELEQEMARSYSSLDNFSLQHLRDHLAMRLGLHQSD